MTIKEIILAALFAALTCVSALISIPITIVPFTLQVLVVLTVGVIVGKKVAFYSQITYVLLGLAGLPVFAGGKSGFAGLAGPTGGYIVSFILAAFIVGWLVENLESKVKSYFTKWIVYISAMLVGLVVIYIAGLFRLSMFIGLEQAIAVSFIPYIIPDLIKLVIGSYIAVLVKVPLLKAGLLHTR